MLVLFPISILLLLFGSIDADARRLRKSGKMMSKGKKSSKKNPAADQTCNSDCPCCNASDWPEFVSAVKAYSAEKCTGKGCCYTRQDSTSDIILLNECDPTKTDDPPYNSAFMSYDYTGTYTDRCVVGRTCSLCGDSAFGLPPIVLTDSEADACDALLRSRVKDVDSCWDEEEDGRFDPCYEDDRRPTTTPDSPSSECDGLVSNTAAALQQALTVTRDDEIVQVTLCSRTIVFEQEVTLPRFVILKCSPDKCVFDGNHTRRLFSFESDDTSRYASMIFENIVFKNGLANGGGAVKLIGPAASRARFQECDFLDNNGTYAYNGGAIDTSDDWFALEAIDCQFVRNTAHTGGAIHGIDTRIYLKNSAFVNNTVCGAGEGPAIFLGSNAYLDSVPEYVHVECVGDNVFEGNLDCVCCGSDYEQPLDDIVSPNSIGCGNNANA